jgi:dynein light chain roadblock-type
MSNVKSEVDEMIKKLQTHKGIVGIITINPEGIPIRSTFPDMSLAVQYAALLTQLSNKTKSSIKDLDQENDLDFLRIRTKKHEIMVKNYSNQDCTGKRLYAGCNSRPK